MNQDWLAYLSPYLLLSPYPPSFWIFFLAPLRFFGPLGSSESVPNEG